MKNSLLKTIVAAGFTVGLLSGTANAAPVIYFGENLTPGGTVTGVPVTARASFLAALSGGVGTEDFEGFSLGDPAPLALSFPGSTGSITATLTGAGTDIHTGGSGRFPTSGNNYVETPGGGDFVIDFGSSIAAFGFYGTDLGDIGNDLVITLTDTNNVDTSFTVDVAGTPNGGLIFWGFTDTTTEYDRITFTNTPGTGDVFGFDDMTIGDLQQVITVSEPGMLASFGLGLIGLGFARRRKQTA